MNKELIKQYKEEFDHWLNGGILLFKPLGLQIFFDTATSPIDWSVEGLYIINDEYVELRKALAEGKTIQWNSNYNKSYEYWADICDQTSKMFNLYTADIMRIKPDEPQFKVGDWIELSTGKFIQVKSIDLRTIRTTCGSSIMNIDKLTKWQPKEDEWVCSIKDSDSFEAYKYKHYTNPRPCQPFIGTLPEGIACN